MVDNACHINLCSHRHIAVESTGNSPGVADPSAAAEPEVTGPGADQNPFDGVAVGNQLPHVPCILPQANEALGNDSDGAAAQVSNCDVSNRAAVDQDNLLATSAHGSVQPDGMGGFDYDNGQFVFFCWW